MKEIQFIATLAILAISIINLLRKNDTPKEVLDKIKEVKRKAKSIDDLVP